MPNTKDKGITPDVDASALELEVLGVLRDKLPRLDHDARVRVIEFAGRLHGDTSKKAMIAAERKA